MKKVIDEKRKKKIKNQKSKVIELDMISIPLRHALLDVTF